MASFRSCTKSRSTCWASRLTPGLTRPNRCNWPCSVCWISCGHRVPKSKNCKSSCANCRPSSAKPRGIPPNHLPRIHPPHRLLRHVLHAGAKLAAKSVTRAISARFFRPSRCKTRLSSGPSTVRPARRRSGANLPDVAPLRRTQVWELPPIEPIITEYREHRARL